MSKQKQGGKGKTPRHSPSDAMQKARTEANRQRRMARNENQITKQRQRKTKTAEQHRVAYYGKLREKLAVRNPEIIYPNGDPRVQRLIASWKAHRSLKGKTNA